MDAIAVERPVAPELPTELWVEILGHLEYSDLVSCIRLNKAARYATQLPMFDVKLWRRQEGVKPQSVGMYPSPPKYE